MDSKSVIVCSLLIVLAGCDIAVDAVCTSDRCIARCTDECGSYAEECCDLCSVAEPCATTGEACVDGRCHDAYSGTAAVVAINFGVDPFTPNGGCWDPGAGCDAGSSGAPSLPDPYVEVYWNDQLVYTTQTFADYPGSNGPNGSYDYPTGLFVTTAPTDRARFVVYDEDGDVDQLLLECASDPIDLQVGSDDTTIYLPCVVDAAQSNGVWLQLEPVT